MIWLWVESDLGPRLSLVVGSGPYLWLGEWPQFRMGEGFLVFEFGLLCFQFNVGIKWLFVFQVVLQVTSDDLCLLGETDPVKTKYALYKFQKDDLNSVIQRH